MHHVGVPTDLENTRFCALGAVLARAAGAGELEASFAVAVMKDRLRKRNTNKRTSVPYRSVAANTVFEGSAAVGLTPEKNNSLEAIHCDHVWPLLASDLPGLLTPEAWMAVLPRLDEVVCVTARENYRLQRVEREGFYGWDKYREAGVELVAGSPADLPAHLVAEADQLSAAQADPANKAAADAFAAIVDGGGDGRSVAEILGLDDDD